MSLSLFRRWRRQIDAQSAAIDAEAQAQWRAVTARLPGLARALLQEQDALHPLSRQFLAAKALNGAGGLDLDDSMRLAIAAQACLCVLHTGIEMFDDFSEVIVYPGEFLVEREYVDDAGVVHDVSGALTGEAMPGGPVVLSWESAPPEDDPLAYNVVIHEFAHKLDLADGWDADGIPRFHPRHHRALRRQEWANTLLEAYDGFCDELDALEARIPADLNPESSAGADWYRQLPIDAYAAEDPAEFFAVSSEAYFMTPDRLQCAYPAWFLLLDRYYRPSSK